MLLSALQGGWSSSSVEVCPPSQIIGHKSADRDHLEMRNIFYPDLFYFSISDESVSKYIHFDNNWNSTLPTSWDGSPEEEMRLRTAKEGQKGFHMGLAQHDKTDVAAPDPVRRRKGLCIRTLLRISACLSAVVAFSPSCCFSAGGWVLLPCLVVFFFLQWNSLLDCGWGFEKRKQWGSLFKQ